MPNSFDNDITSAQVRLADIEQRLLSLRLSEHCIIKVLFNPISESAIKIFEGQFVRTSCIFPQMPHISPQAPSSIRILNKIASTTQLN